VLRTYLPALVFVLLGLTVGTVFATINSRIGPRRPGRTKQDPYECGLPSEVKRGILFDIEVIFLYPVAVQLKAFGTFALVEAIVFVVLLAVAFVYVWRRGALEWR
jgi:NADH-quinone oxidoreductase subunit A